MIISISKRVIGGIGILTIAGLLLGSVSHVICGSDPPPKGPPHWWYHYAVGVAFFYALGMLIKASDWCLKMMDS